MKHVIECTGYDLLLKDIIKAEGYYLYDSKGDRYIDYEAGVWCTALGHNHPQINEVIKSQLDKIIHCGFMYTNPLVEKAAVDVLSTLENFNGKCLFLSSGSEAVEFAIKVARATTENKKLLTFQESYLSALGSSSSKKDEEWSKFSLEACRGCIHQMECSQCVRLKEIDFDKIGTFVLEPGNSGGTVLLPPKNLVEEIAKRIKENGGLIVVDEVTTGVGRTGKWYGFQHYDIKPDLIALGKGIGNGYPVSVVVAEEKLGRLIDDNSIRHSQSHQNDPLGCSIISEVIKVIKDQQLIDRSNELGQYLIRELDKLRGDTKVIKEIRGIGLMIAVEFQKEAQGTLRQLFEFLLKKGFIVGYKPLYNLMRFYPALTMDKEDIDQLIIAMGEFLGMQ